MTQPIEEMNSIFYSVGEVTRLFGVSSSTLNRWSESGLLEEKYGIHMIRGGNGYHYYLKEDVNRVWSELVDTAENEAERNRAERNNVVHRTEVSS